MRDDLRRASSALRISGGSRRTTRVGGHADQQAGLGARWPSSSPHGRSSSMPIIRPWPRISTTPVDAGRARAARPSLQQRADRGGVVEQAVLFHDAHRLDAGAHRQRIAAEGGAVVAGAEHVGRLRPARRRRRSARPSPGPWPAASRRARCRPTGARTTCRCGPCRTAPRRASAASRARRTAARTSLQVVDARRVDAAFALDHLEEHGDDVRVALRPTASSAPMSFSGTRTKPSTSGPKPACTLALPVADSVAMRAAVEGLLVDDDLGPLDAACRGRTCARS